MKNFALTGLAGYIAPRHLQAIRDTGHRLVAAMDVHDSVGIVDAYFPEAAFFTEYERFDRHLEMLRRGPASERVDIVSVCSPNHLHDAHVRLALRVGADALCEKPLVLNPWNLDQLAELETEHGRRVWTILQLRVHPALVALKARIDAEPERRHQVRLTYVTRRGTWYRYSWKGDPHKSGGVPTNIGVHFFDLLQWLFGSVDEHEVHVHEPERGAGRLTLPKADVEWFLSLDGADLPDGVRGEQPTYRSITVDGEEIEFSGGFRDLHTRVYERTLDGDGFGISDARPAIELVHSIRHATPRIPSGGAHPFVQGASRTVEALAQ
ncbi:Gfo/Idh/MocA family oxidoreductase [Rubrivirga sp. IMCC45206]|uniref:Gfo/Idh/MocA family oxidoreductase n=1 Tax=Rubrivirga sp. IMCC45206 TaxID=3391614 RepID=UPI00398FE6CF